MSHNLWPAMPVFWYCPSSSLPWPSTSWFNVAQTLVWLDTISGSIPSLWFCRSEWIDHSRPNIQIIKNVTNLRSISHLFSVKSMIKEVNAVGNWPEIGAGSCRGMSSLRISPSISCTSPQLESVCKELVSQWGQMRWKHEVWPCSAVWMIFLFCQED